ncbi:MAG: hypothetical protein R8F63_15540 [Acidimicrobiales bacterium]|nr:hypothetical protein [Acidimicrobiales bacterium]
MAVTTNALPAAEVTRPRTVLVATMFASAAAFMAFAGVLVIYINERAAADEWFPAGVIELGPAGFVFATMILSVFTVQWAVQAINNDDRLNAYMALGLTGLFGAAVFNQLWFIINDTGFALAGSNAEFLFLLVNGVFLAFLISAVAFLTLTFLRALIGQYGPRKADGVAAAAFYWDTVVAMWSITWYVVYVAK